MRIKGNNLYRLLYYLSSLGLEFITQKESERIEIRLPAPPLLVVVPVVAEVIATHIVHWVIERG